jgi:UDP-N-acetylmuramoyl-L-alanyl-D-glutamate--2,6-diaminopimelate ligase
MGEVAGRLADVVVLTTDNPRHEDQAAIIDDVQRGIETTTHLHIEPDRATAIREAVQMAGSGDVLLVAGKGHETTQTVGERVTHFDDREVLRAALAELGHQEATG